MTIIGRVLDAAIGNPHHPPNTYAHNGSYNVGNAGAGGVYYDPGMCAMCSNSIGGCRHCRRMLRREERYHRRDMRDMRRAARWGAVVEPLPMRMSPQPPMQMQNQYGPMQYSQQPQQQQPQQQQPQQQYAPAQYGPPMQQQQRNREQPPPEAPLTREPVPSARGGFFDAVPPEGPPPPYVRDGSEKPMGREKR